MNLNLNVTLSGIVKADMNQKELDALANNLESLTERLLAKYGRTVAISSNVVSGELLARNKAYLDKMGRQRTPRISEREQAKRNEVQCENWQDVELRHKAMLAVGVDIFARGMAGSDDTPIEGERFTGDVDLETVPVD